MLFNLFFVLTKDKINFVFGCSDSQPPDVTHNTGQARRITPADRVNRYRSRQSSDDGMGKLFIIAFSHFLFAFSNQFSFLFSLERKEIFLVLEGNFFLFFYYSEGVFPTIFVNNANLSKLGIIVQIKTVLIKMIFSKTYPVISILFLTST